ncbi:AraC family transcriptional regulator [Chryseobacterium daecheongense]|uniref:helix-turn-helix domain-containing protein n=1 Tax=Chryseobacterium daecheongense TaxID=192389 RepID=UPI001FD6B790|nr:helix-turn-helix domain-containing protein [Chryseobacterium daecheongense]UOU98432.1 AraC family transcriptional regulator [Chryseobacterium daecheongense]
MGDFSLEPFLFAENSQHYINTSEISHLISKRPEQLLQPHRVSFYAIHLFYEGKGFHSVDFNYIDIRENHMLFVSPNQIAQFHDPSHYKGKVIIFTEDFFCKNNIQIQFLGQTLLFNDPLKLSYFYVGERFKELCSLFYFIETELKRPFSNKQITILNNYLFNILLIAEELYQPKDILLHTHPHQLLVSKFKSLANRDLSYHHSVQHFANELNVNKRTLEKAFLDIEKITPKKWLTERMILEIKRQLTYKEHSITEIAYKLGFTEVTNFSKFFKSKTNLTPTQFVNNILRENVT